MSLQSLSDNVLGKTDDKPQSMEVVTSVLEPIIITDTHARWVLRNEGILSRDSVLQFQLTSSTPGGFLPISAGIYGLIKRATLTIGGKRINHLENLAYWKAMTHSYDTPSYRQNRTRILKGINNVMTNCPLASDNAYAGSFIPAGSKNEVYGQAALDYQMELTSDEKSTPCWSVRLVDLFPILWNIELPLFLCNNEVVIDLELNTQVNKDQSVGGVGQLCCFKTNAGGTEVLGDCKLVKDSCLLYCDHIYYENERMEDVARSVNAKEGLYLNYTDVVGNVASHEAASAASVASGLFSPSKIDQVPLSGFRVKNLFWGETVNEWTSIQTPPDVPTNYRYYNQLMGKYALLAYRKDPSVDLRVNDQLAFPQPLISSTQKATEAENVYASPVMLNQALWSYNALVDKSGEYLENTLARLLPPSSDFELWGKCSAYQATGKQSFTAINLSHGYGDDDDDSIVQGIKPIEVLHNSLPRSKIDNYNRTCRYFAEVVKGFGIQDGAAVVIQGPALANPK